MTVHEATLVAMPIAGPGLLWACTYLVLARMAPLEAMPGFLRQRVLRTSSLAPYVAAASLMLLVVGAVASLCAHSG